MSDGIVRAALNCALFGGQPDPIDWQRKSMLDEQWARWMRVGETSGLNPRPALALPTPTDPQSPAQQKPAE